MKKYEVKGVMVIARGSANEQLPFDEKFILPEMDEARARQIIQKKLISGALKEKNDNFRRVRTCQIVNITKATAAETKAATLDIKKIDEYGFSELCRLALNHELNFDPSKSASVTEARWRLKQELDNEVEENEEESTTTEETTEEFEKL